MRDQGMKEGWEYKKIGEVANVIHGKNQKDVLSEDGQYPIYGSGGTVMGYATDYLCEAGTTILGRKGSINNPKFIEERFWNVDTAFGITPKDDNCSKFIYYFITSIDWLSKNTGTTLPSLTQQVVKDVIIPIPLPSEQQSIVDYLDSAFAKIDAMKANAEKALNEAKALFQASLKEMLEPKDGLEVKKLKEVVVLITDGDHQPPPKSHDGIPFITISNIDKKSNKIDFENTFYVPQSYFSALKKDRIPQKGDVLYTVTGSFGIPVLIDFQKEFCFQRHIALIRSNIDLLSPTYLFYWILSSYATSQAEDTATGAAQRTVSLNSLRNFNIHVPPLSEQQSIVTTLDTLKSKVDRLQENYDKISQECDALKQAILKQVFE